MRRDVLEWLQSNPQIKQFVRSHPIWYRKLTRYPNEKQQLDVQTKEFFKQTWPHKVGKLSNSLEFASMMMQMYGAMRKSD